MKGLLPRAVAQLRGSGDVAVELVKRMRTANVLVNHYHDESPEGLRRQFEAGINFPLVDDVARAMAVAVELGIHPLR